mgnify:CR=1 FL=1
MNIHADCHWCRLLAPIVGAEGRRTYIVRDGAGGGSIDGVDIISLGSALLRCLLDPFIFDGPFLLLCRWRVRRHLADRSYIFSSPGCDVPGRRLHRYALQRAGFSLGLQAMG